jgi:hypothetical protein
MKMKKHPLPPHPYRIKIKGEKMIPKQVHYPEAEAAAARQKKAHPHKAG